MSAFVVNPTHIATCAAIIREIVFQYEDDPPSDTDIRMDLAMANVISVAYRYGPEGRRDNQAMFASTLAKLSNAGWDTIDAALPAGISDVNEACFDDGYTFSDFLSDCRSAKAIPYSNAEACEYLSCLNYQSCESPGWKDSKARMWILESKSVLAGRLARQILGNRRVWSTREPDQQIA